MLYLCINVGILALGTLLFRFKPEFVLSFFAMDEELYAIASNTLQTICLSFIPAAISISLGTVFQSFGKGIYSMFQSVMRQLALLIPIAYYLSTFGRLELVWWAYPIAETIVALIFIPLTIKVYKAHFPS